jgi:hypothetical protein
MANKFWAVWRNTGGSAPSKRHSTKDEAISEASRLCQKEGDPYYILEVIGIVTPSYVPVNYTEIKEA